MGLGTACGVCGGTIGESTACDVCIGYRAARNQANPWPDIAKRHPRKDPPPPSVPVEETVWVQCVQCGNDLDPLTHAGHVPGCTKDTAGPFVKHDADKPRPELLPPHALEEIARVLAFGAQKYTPDNWRKNKDAGRYVGAALRHVIAYMRGERDDPETGRHHLAHAACCAMFIVDMEVTETQGD